MLVIAITTAGLTSQEIIKQKYYQPKDEIQFNGVKLTNENLISTKKSDKILDENFITIDSLANAYSYFYVMENKPYVYDRTTNNLITVKRGFYSQHKLEHAGYSGTNWTYNIFMKMSSDNGFTWSDPILLYDKNDIGYFEARFPTCYGFKMNNTQYVASNFPVIDYYPNGTSEWKGYVSVLWNQANPATIPMTANNDPIFRDVSYSWSNDSKIVAFEKPGKPGEFVWLAASEIYPKNNTDFANASHFALRRVENDIETPFTEGIPDAWNSNKFMVVDQAGSRYNQLIDMRRADDGVIYLACYGRFYNDDPGSTNPNTVGVSRSTDNGLTWEDFEQLPIEVRDAYVSDQGYPGGSFVFNYTTKGFVPFSNGEWSIVVHGALYDAGQQLVGSQIVEIYKQMGAWGMRKVADNSGAYIVYRDVLNTANERQNPSDIELQMAGTADGSALVVKWVDLEDYNSTAGTFRTTDIYLASKTKYGTKWGDKINVTNSDEIDRATLLPDYVPDASNVPIMKLYSKIKAGESERDSQFVAGLDQDLMIGLFSVPVSVENEVVNNSKLNFEVMPNPVNDIASIRLYNEQKSASIDLSVYDILGNKVIGYELSNVNVGTSYHQFKTEALSSGVYYISLQIDGYQTTKMMNVIK
jgi:hypothetical protein